MLKRVAITVALASLVLGACEDPRKKKIEQIKEDEETLQKASGAVSEVIRNSTDCEAARALMPEAYKRIEEASKMVNAPASQATLGVLKAQVDRVAQACP